MHWYNTGLLFLNLGLAAYGVYRKDYGWATFSFGMFLVMLFLVNRDW